MGRYCSSVPGGWIGSLRAGRRSQSAVGGKVGVTTRLDALGLRAEGERASGMVSSRARGGKMLGSERELVEGELVGGGSGGGEETDLGGILAGVLEQDLAASWVLGSELQLRSKQGQRLCARAGWPPAARGGGGARRTSVRSYAWPLTMSHSELASACLATSEWWSISASGGGRAREASGERNLASPRRSPPPSGPAAEERKAGLLRAQSLAQVLCRVHWCSSDSTATACPPPRPACLHPPPRATPTLPPPLLLLLPRRTPRSMPGRTGASSPCSACGALRAAAWS